MIKIEPGRIPAVPIKREIEDSFDDEEEIPGNGEKIRSISAGKNSAEEPKMTLGNRQERRKNVCGLTFRDPLINGPKRTDTHDGSDLCSFRFFSFDRVIAGIVISSGPDGHFDTYEGNNLAILLENKA